MFNTPRAGCKSCTDGLLAIRRAFFKKKIFEKNLSCIIFAISLDIISTIKKIIFAAKSFWLILTPDSDSSWSKTGVPACRAINNESIPLLQSARDVLTLTGLRVTDVVFTQFWYEESKSSKKLEKNRFLMVFQLDLCNMTNFIHFGSNFW